MSALPSRESLGFTPEEIMSMSVEEIFERTHPDDKQILAEHASNLLKNTVELEMSPTIEYRFLCKDNTYRWLSNNRNICYDDDDRPAAIIGSIRDITESRKLQRKLRKSESKYKNLFHNSRVAMFRSSIQNGKILECNQMLAEILGYETIEECVSDFISSEKYTDPDTRKELLDQLQSDGYVEDFQAEVERKDGTTCWVRYSAKIYPELGYLEGAAIDITRMKLLTPAERQVLELIMEGLSNNKIAAHLGRSVRTIEDHRAAIMRKLDVTNVVDLVRAIINCGMK